LRGRSQLRLSALLAGTVVGSRSDNVLTFLVPADCAFELLPENEEGGWYALNRVENASAVGRWSNEILYFPYRPTLFLFLYVTFALLVLLTWVFAPPRWPWGASAPGHSSISR
jgi:hypothetical protein